MWRNHLGHKISKQHNMIRKKNKTIYYKFVSPVLTHNLMTYLLSHLHSYKNNKHVQKGTSHCVALPNTEVSNFQSP